MGDKALEKAAEEIDYAFGSGGPDHIRRARREQARAVARRAVAAYLDGLLAGLPEEAVEAAFRAVYPTAEGKSDHVAKARIREFVTAALRSLRSSTPGQGEGRDDG